jgi:anaerobic C4-dicarboxylate transporter
MGKTYRTIIGSMVGAIWIPAAIAGAAAANVSSAMPGDEALTCDQIYAQGMAESQRDQQARNQRNEQMKRQSMGTAALVTGATMAGGMGGTAQAAQMAAEAQADRQMALLAAPQATNPRLDHLKQLYAQKHCTRK